MDIFGYENARIAGQNAGAGIYSSARWATERLDGFPPPEPELDTRYQLRYLRARVGPGASVVMISRAIVEMGALMRDEEEVPTPVYKCPATRKRSRKQEKPSKYGM